MKSQLNYVVLLVSAIIVFNFHSCNNKPQVIPKEYRSFISHISNPVEHLEILPSHGGNPLPIPDYLTKQQALEDIEMIKYLFSTSYSGFDYWKFKGVDFVSYFDDLTEFVNNKDTILTYQFEDKVSGILNNIYDGHISIVGTGYHQAYRHKSIYYCDILVEKTPEEIIKVIDSQCDVVQIGDIFTQDNPDKYLFKTLSPTGKNHYLIGIHTFDIITVQNLSFNDKILSIPFHGSRLKYSNFDDPEPFYIKYENDIPIVRVTSFADRLYPKMKTFMNSAIELRNKNTIIVNLFYNGGGSSVFPQGFIKNLNGPIQWQTNWANLTSPAITEYYSTIDLSSMPDISPDYKDLILHHKNISEEFRTTPVKKWDFAATHSQNIAGSYDGKLILLTNRRVLSAGEGMVGVSKSVKKSIIVGENTGGSAQFSSTCGFYLPHSKIIANLPRQFILVPGLEECVGYLPDYWLDTHKPVKEVLKWLDDPDNYQFKYSNSYNDFSQKINISPALPKNVKITSPGSKVPKSLAAFSGKWSGIADGVLDNMLVVERIHTNRQVDAIYSWGVAYQWGIDQPGWRRFKGKFENGKLVLSDEESKIKITYNIISDTTLHGSYQRPGIFSRMILTKIGN